MKSTGRILEYIEDEDIIAIKFRRFAGQPDEYNRAGQMPNFTLVLTPEKAEELLDKGFNVNVKESESGDKEYRLKIFARFDKFPPKVYKICGKATIELDEDTVASLDDDDILHINISVNPYHYDVNGKTGIKPYLNKGYFTIAEDRFASRFYNDEPDDEPEELPFGRR